MTEIRAQQLTAFAKEYLSCWQLETGIPCCLLSVLGTLSLWCWDAVRAVHSATRSSASFAGSGAGSHQAGITNDDVTTVSAKHFCPEYIIAMHREHRGTSYAQLFLLFKAVLDAVLVMHKYYI